MAVGPFTNDSRNRGKEGRIDREIYEALVDNRTCVGSDISIVESKDSLFVSSRV